MPLESILNKLYQLKQPTLLVELLSLVINKADYLNSNFWLCHSSSWISSTHILL